MRKSFFCIVALLLSIHAFTTNLPPKHQTDAVFFRAHGKGNARHLNTAKVKAQMDASTALSDDIQSWVKEFIGKYINSVGAGDAAEYIRQFEEKDRDFIDVLVEDATITSDKTKYFEEDNLYTISLVLSVKRKKIFDALSRKLATDKKWERIYDEQKFRALFDAEVKKLK